MTNIFDSHGRINADIDPTSIPEDRRAAFVALAAAQAACDQAESELKAADEKVAECVRAHDHAYAAMPRSTFLDEWRASR
jgi:hypothetical protein